MQDSHNEGTFSRDEDVLELESFLSTEMGKACRTEFGRVLPALERATQSLAEIEKNLSEAIKQTGSVARRAETSFRSLERTIPNEVSDTVRAALEAHLPATLKDLCDGQQDGSYYRLIQASIAELRQELGRQFGVLVAARQIILADGDGTDKIITAGKQPSEALTTIRGYLDSQGDTPRNAIAPLADRLSPIATKVEVTDFGDHLSGATGIVCGSIELIEAKLTEVQNVLTSSSDQCSRVFEQQMERVYRDLVKLKDLFTDRVDRTAMSVVEKAEELAVGLTNIEKDVASLKSDVLAIGSKELQSHEELKTVCNEAYGVTKSTFQSLERLERTAANQESLLTLRVQLEKVDTVLADSVAQTNSSFQQMRSDIARADLFAHQTADTGKARQDQTFEKVNTLLKVCAGLQIAAKNHQNTLREYVTMLAKDEGVRELSEQTQETRATILETVDSVNNRIETLEQNILATSQAGNTNLEKRVQDTEKRLISATTDLAGSLNQSKEALSKDLSGIRSGMETLVTRSDLAGIFREFDGVKSSVADLNQDVTGAKQSTESKIKALEFKLKQIEQEAEQYRRLWRTESSLTNKTISEVKDIVMALLVMITLATVCVPLGLGLWWWFSR